MSCPAGGVVIIPPGRYLLKCSLVLKDSITLRGSVHGTVLTRCGLVYTKLSTEPGVNSKFITVVDPTGFEIGMGIYIASKVDPKDNLDRKWRRGWYSTWAVVTGINGRTIQLSNGINHTYYVPESIVSNHFSAILIPENAKDIVVEKLTIDGNISENDFEYNDFTICGIFTEKGTRNITVKDVLVKEWPCDGFSIQNSRNIKVINCTAQGCRGHGFHPGTSLRNALFDSLKGYQNKLDGIYFYANVQKLILSNSEFIENGWNGIGGIGCGPFPERYDRNDSIISNVCKRNAESGIYCNLALSCTLSTNICLDNSKKEAGKYADIHVEACTDMVLINNTYGPIRQIKNRNTTQVNEKRF